MMGNVFELLKVVAVSFDTAAKWVSLRALAWGDEDDAEGAQRTGTGRDRTQAAAQIDVAHLLTQMGLAIKPLASRTLKALAWFDGHDVVVPWVWDKTKAIVDLLDGETRVYSVGKITVRIRLKSDGSLAIESDGGNIAITATSGDVVLNGGTLRLARETDAVSVTIPTGAVVIAAPGGTVNPTPITLTGTISTGGAAHAKA